MRYDVSVFEQLVCSAICVVMFHNKGIGYFHTYFRSAEPFEHNCTERFNAFVLKDN